MIISYKFIIARVRWAAMRTWSNVKFTLLLTLIQKLIFLLPTSDFIFILRINFPFVRYYLFSRWQEIKNRRFTALSILINHERYGDFTINKYFPDATLNRLKLKEFEYPKISLIMQCLMLQLFGHQYLRVYNFNNNLCFKILISNCHY